MANFTGKIGTPTDGFTLKVEYSYTQSIANNNSVISSIKGYCKKNNSSYYPYNSSKTATIKLERLDDSDNWVTVKTLSNSDSYSFNGVSTSTYLEFVSGSNITIPHKSNGEQKLRITFNVDGKLSSYYPKGSISSTPTLTTIPRASTPTLSVSSVAMGSSVTIKTNRASDSFTHTLTYKFGNASGTIATGVGDNYAWKPELSLANQIPNNYEGTGTITCQTYNGSTLVGSKSINIKLTVPSSVIPSISSIALSAGNSNVPSNWGLYVQGKSQLKVVTSASGSYGSTIKTYKITGIDNNTYWSSNFTSSTLQIAGTRTITVTVTDSRGRTATKTTTYTCVAYSNPSISTATVTRCNSDGTANEEGTYVKYSFKANVASVSSKNTYAYKLGYKSSTSSSYTYITISNSAYTLDKSNVVISGVTFSVDNSYDFQFLVSDYFTSTAVIRNIGTGFTLMDFNASGKGMAIGKVSEGNKFEVALPTELNDTTKLAKSTGDVFYHAKKTDSGTEIGFGVGSGGINHGLWSFLLNKWMIYGDASNVYLNGTAEKANKIGINTRNTTDTWMPVYRDGYLEYTQRQIVNSVSHTDWPNNQDWLPTKSFLSYWNGAYNSSGNSNLSKCSGGTICAEKSKSIVASENDTSSYIVLGSLLICWGNTTITPTANTPTSKTINFPKSFSLKPVVVCTPATSVPGTTVTGVGVNEISGTGCKLWVTRTGTASTSVLWIAIGQAS